MFGAELEDSVKRQMLDKVRTNASAFPVLAQISSMFSRNAADCVRDFLGTLTETVGSNFSVKRYGAFIDNTPMPAMIAVLSVGDTNDAAAMSLDLRFANIITDLAMGGDMPDIDALEGRAPTSLDGAICTMLVNRLLNMFDQVMDTACGETIGLMRCQRFENVPIMVDIAPERSELISFQVFLEIGEAQEPAGFELALPLTLLEPVREQLQYSTAPLTEAEIGKWSDHMRNVIDIAPMSMRAELARLPVDLGALLDLEVGDVLPIGVNGLDEIALTVTVDNEVQTIAYGRLGTAKSVKAIMLDGPLDETFLAPYRGMAG